MSENRPCIENSDYVVDRLGNVYSVCRRQRSRSGNLIVKHHDPVLLKGSADKYGYRTYRMVVDGKKKHIKGHRLVLNAFRGVCPNKSTNHLDGDKQNNRLDNLEWVTVAENNRHAIETGLADPVANGLKAAEKNRKIQLYDYVTVYALNKHANWTRTRLAKLNNVSRQTIDNIVNRVQGLVGAC